MVYYRWQTISLTLHIMASKTCPNCSEPIQETAKKCKHCGSDLRNWFMRHKILGVLLAFLLIGIMSAVTGGETSNSDSSTGTSSIIETESKITKANCDLIKSGMTADQVKNILGKPTSTSESEIAGLGKSDFWQYQEGFSLQACSVTFSNGKVFSKTWTDL